MQNATVVAGLMLADVVLLFQNRQATAGLQLLQFQSRCQPDNSAADKQRMFVFERSQRAEGKAGQWSVR